MVHALNGLSRGCIGKKLPSDNALNNMTKIELIELLRLAQHNYTVLMGFYSNEVKANKEAQKKRKPIATRSNKNTNKKMNLIVRKLEAERADFEMFSNKTNPFYRNGVLNGIELAIDIVKGEIK